MLTFARSLAVAVGMMALTPAVGSGPPAAAAPLERTQNVVDSFSCVFATEEGPTVFFFGESSTAGSGSAAFVEGDGVYLEGWEGTVVFGDGTLTAAVDLATVPEDEPRGTVSVSARTTLGGATVEEVDDRSGNTWTRGTITTADYTFDDVVLGIDGFTPIVDDMTCSGERITFDVRSTDPASRVYRDARLDSLPCAIEGMPDAELLLSGSTREPFLEIVFGAQGDDPHKAQGVLERVGASWSASLALIQLVTGEQADTLDVAAEMSIAGAPVRERLSEGGFAEMAWVLPYEVHYRIVTADGTELTAHCDAILVRSRVTISPQISEH